MILTEELLERVSRTQASKYTILGTIARRRKDRTQSYIDQINKMWDAMPENARKGTDLAKRITGYRDDSFRGASAELITNWVVRPYLPDIIHSPSVQGQTPDFYARNRTHTLFIETFCLGPSKDDDKYHRLYSLAAEEIRPIKANYWVMLEGSPTPNKAGHLNGIGDAVGKYLGTLSGKQDPEKIHRVERDGAAVFFTVFERKDDGSIFLGAQQGLRRGDRKINSLTKSLEKKVKKYPFPFIASCVVDSTIDADLHTLANAMFGPIQALVPVVMPGSGDIEKVTWKHSGTGFWGTKNRSFPGNLLVQAILFIRKRYEGGGFKLEVHLLENPHVRTGLTTVFADIPDVLHSEFTGDRMEMPGKEILL